ncbi:hypothetical protein BLA29_010161 [Euroglyphus maynei]|uniref:Uncharacterized protein n=1 Tax=Euroglyphus maynei TaxID=6958 RepID=A0A1Y3B4W8_EURMA|nr:hypothetical protein BLA29_010161 [Euroglyphus maynei]
MRVTVLEISAELENITDLSIESDYEYHMHFRCKKCMTETDLMKFSSNNKVPLMGDVNNVHVHRT